MEELKNKLETLNTLIKALLSKPDSNSLVPALKIPTPKPLSMPSVSTGPSSKIPGVTPTMNKDPVKMTQQLKNPRPGKVKVEVLKTASNGQWSLSKSVDEDTDKEKV